MPASVRVQYGAAISARNPEYIDGAAVRRLLRRAVRAALRHESVDAGEISVTLLDNAEIAGMNASFLQHEGPTDVISFALYEEDEDVVGDVYVGFDVARRQALAAGLPLEEELVRLTVHGTLHVLGYDHPDGADRLESEMWEVQEQVVARMFAS